MMTRYRTTAEIQRDLGQKVRALRLNHDITQSDLAEKAHVSRTAAQNLERGDASLETFVRILHALDVDASDFVPAVPTVDPIAVFRQNQAAPRQRAGRSKLAGP